MKVTVITATLNSRSTIDHCLEGCVHTIASNGCEVEQLVVDGGSSDGTVELIHANHPGVRVETQTGKGLYQALNEGVLRAGGDYIMFLHSDDELGKVDLRNIELGLNIVVYGMVEFIDDNGRLLFRRRAPLFPKRCLSQYPFIFHPNAIYPRWLLLKYPFDSDKYGTAADMWQINAFRNEAKFVPSKAIVYRFRIHKESTTVKNLERRPPMSYWLWRVYVFLFFEDHRLARVLNLLHGRRTWS